MTLRIIFLLGAAFAALTADAKQSAVTAPGGMRLGQSVEEAVGSEGAFFYGNTCYGELAVSGAILTAGGLVHIMGYVDEKTQIVDAIEADFVEQVATADLNVCNAAVRQTAKSVFPAIDWRKLTARTYFLGGADRTYMSASAGGIRYEIWGDLEMIVGSVCTVSWRVASGGRTFDVQRVPAF